ncbi:MAG TPA: tRNA guanosine(34) transglycosylase Tgt [Candidatus Gracilibacteria bacterium]|mgnify:CR=1 FL=1|nr:tRNA guanosine(34) transglycosylase Tgt [Candidatus Gracilibacteria bacterium]
MFEFKIIEKASEKSSKANISLARTGIFKTPHGEVRTPVFMPVGTRATVKTLSPEELKELDAEIILSNTYHLMLRPGEKTVKKMGRLHKWMNWNKPILTDSGGFQVFSLEQEKGLAKDVQKKAGVKITEEGVEFKSHLDGKKYFITPEKATQIQHDLGADIIMAFDECAPADSSKKYFEEALNRTHNWLERCKKEHDKLEKKKKKTDKSQALFGIVQGGVYKDLRRKSAEFVASLDLPGNAIGGLSVGEDRKTMLKMIDEVTKILPENKPRYLMGVGTPIDLLECVDRGIDMFDCVLPTRLARHAAFWTTKGLVHIKNQKFKEDPNPLEKNCTCYACKNFSCSYIHHLMRENEILGHRLMTIHNLHFLLNLMAQIRDAINKGKFKEFKKKFLAKWPKKTKNSNI